MTDYTGSINGLAIGPGTPFMVEPPITGWLDYEPIALGGAGSSTVPAPRALSNGSWPVPYRMPQRDVGIVLNIVGTLGLTMAAARAQLDAATLSSTGGTVPVTLTVDGIASMVNGYVGRSTPIDLAYAAGLAVTTLSITCLEPRRLSPSALTASAALSTGSGSMSMTNVGTATAPVTAAVTGPFTSVTLMNTTAARTLTLAGSVAAGTTVTIDMNNRTVVDQAGNNLAALVTARGWWGLAAGNNAISVSTTGESSATAVTLTGYSAWL